MTQPDTPSIPDELLFTYEGAREERDFYKSKALEERVSRTFWQQEAMRVGQILDYLSRFDFACHPTMVERIKREYVEHLDRLKARWQQDEVA